MKTRILIAALALSGCSLWDDYKRPPMPVPNQGWRDEGGVCIPAIWPDTQWWTQFNSEPLTLLMQEALTANDDLKVAVAQVREADAQAKIAGAGLFPSVEADGQATRGRTGSLNTGGLSEYDGLATTSGRSPLTNQFEATVSAAYELDFWGKNWATAEAARALATASHYDEQTVRLTVLSSVGNLYFDIIATKERIAVARANLASTQALLEAFQKRFQVGTATALDIAQEESVVAAETTALPPLTLELEQDLNALAILVGKLPELIDAPDGKLADIAVPEIAPGMPSELLERRPDVQSAEEQLRSANANIIVARAAFFPSIDLTGDLGYRSVSLTNLVKPGSQLFSVGASLTQPIFEGGALIGQLHYTKARYDELLSDYHKSVISAFSDAENALAAVQQNATQEDGQANAVKIAQNAYELSQRQFNGGIVDITTVLNTQRTLFAAQDALLVARDAHLQAIVGLYTALGGGWKVPTQP